MRELSRLDKKFGINISKLHWNIYICLRRKSLLTCVIVDIYWRLSECNTVLQSTIRPFRTGNSPNFPWKLRNFYTFTLKYPNNSGQSPSKITIQTTKTKPKQPPKKQPNNYQATTKQLPPNNHQTTTKQQPNNHQTTTKQPPKQQPNIIKQPTNSYITTTKTTTKQPPPKQTPKQQPNNNITTTKTTTPKQQPNNNQTTINQTTINQTTIKTTTKTNIKQPPNKT